MTAYEMLMGKPQDTRKGDQLALTLYRHELNSIDDKLHRDQCKKYFQHTEKTLNKRKGELIQLIANLEKQLAA